MNNYRILQQPRVIDSNYLADLRRVVINNPNFVYVINYKNTKSLSFSDLRNLESVAMGRVKIRIEGGYDDHRIISYPSSTYVNMHKYDNIYDISEMRKIMTEIEKIESGINPNWSQGH